MFIGNVNLEVPARVKVIKAQNLVELLEYHKEVNQNTIVLLSDDTMLCLRDLIVKYKEPSVVELSIDLVVSNRQILVNDTSDFPSVLSISDFLRELDKKDDEPKQLNDGPRQKDEEIYQDVEPALSSNYINFGL